MTGTRPQIHEVSAVIYNYICSGLVFVCWSVYLCIYIYMYACICMCVHMYVSYIGLSFDL